MGKADIDHNAHKMHLKASLNRILNVTSYK
jgi:hypothetical protein